MGHAALLKPKLFPDLADVVGLRTQQLHDGKPRRIGERPKELSVQAS